MRLRIRLDRSNLRRWLIALLDHVVRLPGIELQIAYGTGCNGFPANADRLLRFDAFLGRQPVDGLSATVDAAAFDRFSAASETQPDLILDLCGDSADLTDAPVWGLTFDGQRGEGALLAACLAGRPPLAAIVCAGETVASARLGLESRVNLLVAYEDALVRTTTLLLAALVGKRPMPPVPERQAGSETPENQRVSLLTYAPRATARAVARRLQRAVYRTPHWRVGWRKLDGPDAIDLRAHPPQGWRILPDDGTRFYADPFPIEHEGRTQLFVEDFDYRRNKAVISVVEFGPEGPLGEPVPVLDEPHHLSYPFVFARDGEVWLIPESCANRTVDLYRATAFPSGWVKEATLLSEIVASDATLVEHGGLWWMLATVRDLAPPTTDPIARGSFSDALHLWSARDFRGPWTPHRQNPVLIDVASARSAGRMVERDGALLRPVQDCRRWYGEALSIARIDRLDEDGYAQTVESTLRSGPAWPGVALHTLNRTRDFEFIDGCGRSPRYGFLTR